MVPRVNDFSFAMFIWLSIIVERKYRCQALYGLQCRLMLTARIRWQVCVSVRSVSATPHCDILSIHGW